VTVRKPGAMSTRTDRAIVVFAKRLIAFDEELKYLCKIVSDVGCALQRVIHLFFFRTAAIICSVCLRLC
jgi:hypothetical protein